MISEPSAVRMTLARMPMRLTSPTLPPTSMTSPTLMGRSKSRIRPDTKLLITFCNPNPMPTVNAPARIVTFAKSITTTQATLNANLAIGSFSITLGGILAFLITVWASFLISKFLRFVLEEDVYHHLRLAAGIPYAISTMLHYAILLVGFFVALGALGIDLTKLTILAGAFSVGIGFGLQNIVNNFVSGLILLFERPIKVGDVIEVGGNVGEVSRIGIRASVIRTADGSEIIVPNGSR